MPYSIINDSTNNDTLFNFHVNGHRCSHGYDETQVDDNLLPKASRLFGDAPGQLKEIPESDWDGIFEEQERLQSSLEHIRMRGNFGQMMKSLDQNGQGYCWSYSSTSAVSLIRASANMPYVRLSGHANACMIKNGRDEGGWGGLSADYIMKNGVPSVDFWPEKSMRLSNNTPEMRANAKTNIVTEDWSDQSVAVYDRNLTRGQYATLLLCNIPVVSDFNWWSHSVVAMRWYRIERGSWGPKIWNSWTDSWEDNGMSVLQGNKGRPDGAVALRVAGASIN